MPARREKSDQLEQRRHQDNHGQDQRERSQTEQGVHQIINSARDEHNSDQHLPDHSPRSPSAERRD